MGPLAVLEAVLRLKDELSPKLVEVSGKLQEHGARAQQVGRNYEKAGRSVLPFSAAILAAGAAAFTVGSQFDTSLTRIETLVGDSRASVQGFRDDILELSGETARAPRELGDAMFYVESAGLRGDAALGVLRASAQAAALGLGDTATIADAATSAMNAYGPEVLSGADATNILALAVRAGKLEASELAPVMGSILPLASSMHVRFQDVAGTMAVMSRTGLDAARSSTAVRGVLQGLLRPSDGAREALGGVNLTVGDLRARLAQPGGLIEAMRLLQDRFAGNEEALAKVFPNVEGLSGVLNVLSQDAATVDDVMAQVASGTDVLGSGMKRLAEDDGFKFQQLLALAQVRLVELRDQLAPTFAILLDYGVQILEWAGSAIEYFGRLPQPVQTFALALTGVVVASGPLLILTGKLISSYGVLTSALGKLIPALVSTATAETTAGAAATAAGGGFKAAAAALVTPPLGLALALTALGAAFTIGILKALEAKRAIEEYRQKAAETAAQMRDWEADAADLASAYLANSGNLEGARASAARYLEKLKPTREQVVELTKGLRLQMQAGHLSRDAFDEINFVLRDYIENAGMARDTGGGVADASDEMARAQGALLEQLGLTGGAMGSEAGAATALDKALQSMGFTTESNAVQALAALQLTVESGVVPVRQSVARYEELRAKYAELGVITPAVQAQLDAIKQQLLEQGAVLDPLNGRLLTYEQNLARIQKLRIAEWQEGWKLSAEETAATMGDLGEASLDFLVTVPEHGPEVTAGLDSIFGKVKTGIPLFDDLINKGLAWMDSLLSGLPGVGNLFGSIFGKDGKLASLAQQLFGGGAGSLGGIIGSALGGPLGSIVGNFGGQLGQKILGGLKSVLGGIGSFFSGLFGGPDEAELEARDIVNTFESTVINGILDGQQQVEAAGEQWRANNIAIRDAYLAIGYSEQEAAAAAARLSDAVRRSPEEAAAVVQELQGVFDQVQEAMDATGLTLTELRDKAINDSIRLGISVEEAFNRILASVEDSASGSGEAVDHTLREVRAQMAKLRDQQLATIDDVQRAFAAGELTKREAIDATKASLQGQIPALLAAGPAGQRAARQILQAMREAGMGGTMQLRKMLQEAGVLEEGTKRALRNITADADIMQAAVSDDLKDMAIAAGAASTGIEDQMVRGFDAVVAGSQRMARDVAGYLGGIGAEVTFGVRSTGGDVPSFQTRHGEFHQVPGPPGRAMLALVHGEEYIGRPEPGVGASAVGALVREVRKLRDEVSGLRSDQHTVLIPGLGRKFKDATSKQVSRK